MKRIFCLLLALTFFSGCALSTIRPPKKKAKPARKPAREKRVERPKPVVVEKEEVLPLRKRPEPMKEEILPLEEEGIK